MISIYNGVTRYRLVDCIQRAEDSNQKRICGENMMSSDQIYQETTLCVKDGLPKLRGFPAEMGGSGDILPEYDTVRGDL